MQALTQLRSYWIKTPFKGYVYAAFILNILACISILIAWRVLPPVVPLFYGKPLGTDQLVSRVGLLIAPAFSVLIIILNTFFSFITDDDFFKKTLISGAFVLSLLTTITVVKIIFLVGFF